MALGVNSLAWLNITCSDNLSRHKNDQKKSAILQNGNITMMISSTAE